MIFPADSGFGRLKGCCSEICGVLNLRETSGHRCAQTSENYSHRFRSQQIHESLPRLRDGPLRDHAREGNRRHYFTLTVAGSVRRNVMRSRIWF